MLFPGFKIRVKSFFWSAAFTALVLGCLYGHFWGWHVYRVTAYCNCPVCINVPEYRDNRFASGKRIHWGGVAADASVPFGSRIELVPLWPQDWKAVFKILGGRRKFIVEDRGGKIRNRAIDIFIPDSRGGHKTALRWGVHYMRVKINGRWAD